MKGLVSLDGLGGYLGGGYMLLSHRRSTTEQTRGGERPTKEIVESALMLLPRN
jgi:hypothetical protein